IKVFDTLGNRKNRNKARMKFVIEKLGFQEFTRRWEEAYIALGHTRPNQGPIKLLQHQDEPVPLLMPASTKGAIVGMDGGNGDGNENGAQQESLRSEEHTSELQSRSDLVCRLLLEK